MNLVIFDSSVLVEDLRTGRDRQRIRSVDGLVRNSSVVLAELWRGASKAADREFLLKLGRNHPTLTPTENIWHESGELLAKIRVGEGFSLEKLRDLHFDVLVALTARSFGARLITSDRDFELILRYREFQLEMW